MEYKLELDADQSVTRLFRANRANLALMAESSWYPERKFFDSYLVSAHGGHCYVDVFWYSRHLTGNGNFDILYGAGPSTGIYRNMKSWEDIVYGRNIGRIEIALVTARNELLNGEWWAFLRKG